MQTKDKLIRAESLKNVHNRLQAQIDNALFKTTQSLTDAEQSRVLTNLGMQKYMYSLDAAHVTLIPSNADLNNYRTPGTYGISTNRIAETVANMPPVNGQSGKLIIENTVAGSSETYYIRQIYHPYKWAYEFVRITYDGGTTWSNWYGHKLTDYQTKHTRYDILDTGGSMVNCEIQSGGAVVYDKLKIWSDGTDYYVAGRWHATYFHRTAAYPQIIMQTNARPEYELWSSTGICWENDVARPEIIWVRLKTNGQFSIEHATETGYKIGETTCAVGYMFPMLKLIRYE